MAFCHWDFLVFALRYIIPIGIATNNLCHTFATNLSTELSSQGLSLRSVGVKECRRYLKTSKPDSINLSTEGTNSSTHQLNRKHYEKDSNHSGCHMQRFSSSRLYRHIAHSQGRQLCSGANHRRLADGPARSVCNHPSRSAVAVVYAC